MPRSRSGTTRFLALGALAATIVAGAWLWREMAGSGNATDAPARVVVPRGASVRVAAESLSARGVIGSTRLFRLYARFSGRSTSIKPGAYQFAPAAGYRDVLDALVTGRGLMRTVVIPEGLDLRDLTPTLVRALDVPEDSVRAAVTDSAWIAALEIPVPSLEGYLFPATYTFPEGITAREAVTAMLERFRAVWKPEWDTRVAEMGITRHQAITMASIVEKEARKAEERPIISAVYWNRVKKGMLLQADPTVQYALPRHVERVLYKDLEVESKYNTYRNPGLPPGPIANPGEASIAAALAPAEVPYLFFVARADGSHVFTETFAEHSRAIAEVRAAQRKARAEQARRTIQQAVPRPGLK
jgi:UPF0755 protein